MQSTVTNNSLSEIDELNKEAWSINRKDDIKALELANLALQKSIDLNYSAGIALAKKTIGACYIWKSENEKGAQYSFEAIALFKILKDKINEAAVYVNLGTNFYFLSDYDTAIKFYKTSFDINSDIKNEPGMASSLNGIGAVYCAIEQYDKALESLLLSEKYCLKNEIKESLISVQDSIAESYLSLGDYRKSLEYYDKCLTHAKEIGSLQDQAYAINGLGNNYTALKEFDKALEYFHKCLSIRKEIGFKFGEVATLTNIGNLYIQKKEIPNAIKYLKEAYSIATQVGSKEGIYQSSEKLADLFEKENNINEALYYHKIFYQAKEDVRNHKNAQLSKSFELQNKVLQSQTERTLLEERTKELENYSNNLVLMSEIGQKIISQLNVADIVETVYGQVNGLMDAAGFGIGLFHEEAQQIIFPLFIEGGEKFNNIVYNIDDKEKLSIMCFKGAREIIINDFDNEIDKYFAKSLIPTFGKKALSIIYLPLTVKGKTVGVITVQSFNTNAYSPYHVNILRNLASYTAIALENASLYQEQERKIEERTVEVISKKEEVEKAYQNNKRISELGQQITTTLNFEEIFDKLYNCISNLMDAGSFGVRIYNPKKNSIEYKYGIEKGVRSTKVIEIPMTDMENYSVLCILRKKEIFINDLETEYAKYTTQIRVVSGDMPHSMIFFPIVIGEKILGCITVQSFLKYAYTDYHLDILKTLATYTAIAIENANVFEVMEEKVKERTLEVVKQKEEVERTYHNTQLLGTIGNDITSTLSVDEIIDKVYANLNTLMDASVFGIGIYNLENDGLTFPASIEKGRKLPPHSYTLENKQRPAVKCFESQIDYWANNFSDELIKAGTIKQKPVAGENTESIIYVPVTHKNKKLGVLTVQSFSANAYTNYHLQIVKNLAVYVAIALENANLYANLEERVVERTEEIKTAYQNSKLLSELGQQITSSLNFEEIFAKLNSYVSGLMDAGFFGVRLYNPKKNVIEYKYGIEKGKRNEVMEVPMSDIDNYSVWCVLNRKEIFINDNEKEYQKYTQRIRVVTGDMPHSLIFYPILIGEKVLGCISVQSFMRNAYTDYHLDIIKTLATYTAIALENANQFEVMEEKVNERTLELVQKKEEVEKTYQNTKLLSKIGNDITSILSLKDIVQNVYANVNNLMDAAGFGIGVYKKETHRIEFPLYIEGDDKFDDVGYSADEPDKLASICFNNKSDIVINDFKNEIAKYVGYVQPPLQGKVVESIIYLPLILKEKVLGVITVQSFNKNAYGYYDVEMLRNLAVYVAIAIDNAGLYNGLEERVKERTDEINTAYQNNRLLSEIGQEITSTLNFEDIFERLHKYINRLMHAEVFSVRIYHPESDTVEYKFEIEKGVRDYEVFSVPADPDGSLTGWVIKNKKEILINDYRNEAKTYSKNSKVIVGEIPDSLLLCPMLIGERVLGAITVQCFKKNAYTAYHLDILKNLASYTAIAFDNAALYETMEDKVNQRTAEVVLQKEEIEKTYENTRILSQIGKDISTTFSIQEIINKVYTNLNTLMDATCFGIGIYREKSNEIVFPSTIEKKKSLMAYTYSLKDIDRPAVWCYTTQNDYIINHFSEEFVKSNKVQDYQAKEGDNPESIIYVPITQNEKKIGVITVQSFKANAYKEYHLQILKSLSVYVAIAIDNASLYNNLEDRVRERTEEIQVAYENTRLLGQIAEDISSSLSVEKIISKVYQNVNKIIKADCFGIGIYNPQNNELEFKGFVENDQLMEDFGYSVSDPNRLASQCFVGKKDILINDYTVEYVNYIKGIQVPVSGKDSASIIYLPIYAKEKLIGVITVQSFDKNVYSEYQYNILKGIAVSVGIALDNASLYQTMEEKVNERTKEVVKQKEEIEKANENTRLLSQIGKDITSTLSVAEIIEKVYSNVNNLMDATGFGIGVFNKDKEQIIFPVYIEGDEKFENIVYEKADVNRLTNVCFYDNREILINNYLKDIKHYITNYVPPLKGQSVESIIYLPLLLKEKPVGVITVQSFKRNTYTDYHVQILKNLAVYVAIAIDNASLYQNMEHRVIERTKEVTQQKEQLEKNFNDTKLIAQISKVITSSLSVETIVSMAYENINNLMSAECFGIGLYNEKTQSLQFPGFIERSEKMPFFEFFLKDKNRFAVWCFENEEEILIDDLYTEYNKYIKDLGAPIAGESPLSIIYIPLFSKEKKIGVITMQSFSKGAYSEYQLNILRNLANSVAIGLDNAALYENLEEKVKVRTEEVFRQKAIIEEKNKDITDSIQYAKKIQLALMTETNLFNDTFKESFVYFKPKDIVSGDFYWATKKMVSVVNEKGVLENQEMVYLAVCDSTGHGVPGAFMSLLNISFLNEAINEKNLITPNDVFNYVRQKLITNISKEGQKDGFDGTLLCINKTTNEVTYSSAFNSPILVTNERLIELDSDRMPVGHGEREDKFSLKKIDVKKGDKLYLFTDGYADQFGGPRGKKFMYKKLNEFIYSVSGLALTKQAELFGKNFDDWKGNLEQIDDVCIIGLKF